MDDFAFTCGAIDASGVFRLENTGYGADRSPEFVLKNLSADAATCAIVLEDLSLPYFDGYTHWVIWNIPAAARIPGGLPRGKVLPELGMARQGIAYGWHRYAGPKPPKGHEHTYRFTVYVLDSTLHVPWPGTKKKFLAAAEGHVLQNACAEGVFRRDD